MARTLETNPDEFFFTELQFHESYLEEATRTVRDISRRTILSWVSRMIERKVFRQIAVEVVSAIVIGSFTRQIKGRLENNEVIDMKDFEDLGEAVWDALRCR